MSFVLTLSSAGMALCAFLVVLLLASPRGAGSGKPLLAVVFLDCLLFFAAGLVKGADGPELLALSLAACDGLCGLPAIYLFSRTLLGEPHPAPLRHFVPAAAFIVAAAGLALSGLSGLRGFAVGALLLLDILSFLAETALLVFYGRRCLVLAFEPRRPDARRERARRFVLLYVADYAILFAWGWVGAALDLAARLRGAPEPPDLSWVDFSLVLAFTVLVGLSLARRPELLFGAESEDRRPKYGGVPLDRARAEGLLARARAWLSSRDDLSEAEVSPRALAEALGASYHTLSRAANELGGSSLAELIQAARLERAAALLLAEPRASVLDIAFRAGFAAKSSFNEAFKRRYGESPREYRRRAASPDSRKPDSRL